MDTRTLAAALSAAGLRPTQQRIAVYAYLLAHPTHPTADTIYQAMAAEYPTFSRTTIYNSLRALSAAGLIRTLNIEAEEQRFDGTACGEIFDFPLDEEKLAALCPEGYEVQVRDVYLQGRCPACGTLHHCPQ